MTSSAQHGRTCPHGHPVTDSATFCPVCGSSLAASEPGRHDRDERPPRWRGGPAAFIAVLVVLAGIAIGITLISSRKSTPNQAEAPPLGPSATTASPGTSASGTGGTSSGAPRTVGDVDYNNAHDSRAPAVAETLDQYFSGINTRNYERSRAVIDPRSPINPGSDSSWQAFVDGVSTTTDSNIVLNDVKDDPTGGGSATALVTFRSNQAAGHGPAGSEQETCSRWNLTYTLSKQSTGDYMILATTANHSPC